MKEPGQLAWEAHEMRWAENLRRGWREINPHQQSVWAAVEAAVIEECARVAKTAWLTCPFGEIADADAMCALSEHTEAAIRARAALAPVSGFNEPTPHTPQYPPHVVPTWKGKGES